MLVFEEKWEGNEFVIFWRYTLNNTSRNKSTFLFLGLPKAIFRRKYMNNFDFSVRAKTGFTLVNIPYQFNLTLLFSEEGKEIFKDI